MRGVRAGWMLAVALAGCPDRDPLPGADAAAAATPDARVAECGNGLIDDGEVCDDGNTINCDGCPATCTIEDDCGNGVVDLDACPAEECDDGNLFDGDGCSRFCMVEFCGNSLVDVGEVCDDGNNVDCDGCSANCFSDETCGNNIIDYLCGFEICDDGNNDDFDPITGLPDGCPADCVTTDGCGNGIVDLGEECDGGPGPIPGRAAETLTCDDDCSIAFCGDFDVNMVRGEDCDTGVETATCDGNCTSAVCGDFYANGFAGEECDEGGMATSTCNADCTVP